VTRRVVVLLSHPDFEHSVVNRGMVDGLVDLEEVTVRHLDALYPDFGIDVEVEQAVVREHDVLVFQHPLYWYSSPPLLKQWIDRVLLRDFAFGRRDPETRGKRVLSAVSAGGPESAYAESGFNAYPVEEFLRVFERTAVFCKMTYEPPMILHNVYRVEAEEVAAHAREYRRRIEGLIGG